MANTFSESWYRVANVRTALRPTVRIRKQRFRGAWWYVIHDAFNNVFFRLDAHSYAFISRLSLSRTVDEVWNDCMEASPDSAPGQATVLQLLTQFNNNNLLYFDTPTDSAKLFEKQQKNKKRETLGKWASFLYVRLNLWDPNLWLTQVSPLSTFLFSRYGLLLWLSVVGAAIHTLLPRLQELGSQLDTVLAPGNLIPLYVGMVMIKLIHEFGHGAACKHFGGEVHVFGVVFILFTPMPFVDASSSWGFRLRRHRALVGAAGMIFELFVAALAVFVWAYSSPGLVHNLAYNMMFSASVSTLAFNANPLMKFDGYFLFSDLMDIPNLQARSRSQLTYVAERFLFGVQEATNMARTLREGIWLVVYGVGSSVYKVFVTVFILLFVIENYLIVGAMIAVMLLFLWLVVPPFKLARYLLLSPRLAGCRGRAVMVTLFLSMLTMGGATILSVPHHVRASGVTESAEFQQVLTETPGELAEIMVKSGHLVEAGQPLVRLANRELALDLQDAELQWQQVLIQEKIATSQRGLQMEAVGKQKESVAARLDHLKQQRGALVVRARQNGIWVAPNLMASLGGWLPRGTEIGTVLDPDHSHFLAVVSQEEAASLFADPSAHQWEVRLHGQSDRGFPVTDHQIIPYQREQLPSAALGWKGGGDVAVAGGDGLGKQSLEPFFLIRAGLKRPETPETSSMSEDGRILHGHSGVLRITLASQPLWKQLELKLRQFLQQRFRT